MVTGRLRRRSWGTPEGEAVGDRAEGRRRRRLAQGGSRPGRTQRPAGERRPHLGCPVPGLWRRISASSATAWLPSRGLNRPGFTGTVLCPWFRGAAWLDSHATVKAFSNSIGVSMPRLRGGVAACRRPPGTQRCRASPSAAPGRDRRSAASGCGSRSRPVPVGPPRSGPVGRFRQVLGGSRLPLPRVEVSLAQALSARVPHHVGPEDELDDAAREILPSVA